MVDRGFHASRKEQIIRVLLETKMEFFLGFSNEIVDYYVQNSQFSYFQKDISRSSSCLKFGMYTEPRDCNNNMNWFVK